MGCGSSQPITTSQTSLSDRPVTNNNAKSPAQVANGELVKNGQASPKKEKKNGAQVPSDNTGDKSAPKSIAFEVNLETDIDKIISRHPPKRLKRLEPIANLPTLTAEQLLEKQKQADEKRQQQLDAKREASQKQSRLHRRLQKAREFEKAQKQYTELEIKQRSADINREQKQKEIEAKQKLREERAKRAREKARKLQNEDGIDEVDFEVEKDDYFNKEENLDTDSWLDGDNNTEITNLSSATSSRAWSGTDRVYSGKESPVKPYKPHTSTAQNSHVNTSESVGYTFHAVQKKNDDFWD